MKITQLSKAHVKNWSGGTTTELFIFPEQSSFSEGSFSLRISLATVEQPKTVFSPLAHTQRTLLVLEGTQFLQHKGHHSAHLKALQQDAFSGDWTTHCQGMSTNFNVMTKGKHSASVKVEEIQATTVLKLGKQDALTFIYVLKGAMQNDGGFVQSKEGVSFQNVSQWTIQKSSQIVVVSYPLKSDL